MHQGVLTLNSSGLIVHAWVRSLVCEETSNSLWLIKPVVYAETNRIFRICTTDSCILSNFHFSSNRIAHLSTTSVFPSLGLEHCQSTYFTLPNLWVQLYSCLYSLNIRRFVYRYPHMLLVRAFSHILSSRRVCLVDHTSALLSGAWAVLWKDCLHSVLLLPSGASVQQTSPHQLKENWGDWLPLQYSGTETGTFARSCWRLCSL